MTGFTGKVTLNLCFIGRERVWCLELMSPTNIGVIHTTVRTTFYLYLAHFQKEGDLGNFISFPQIRRRVNIQFLPSEELTTESV